MPRYWYCISSVSSWTSSSIIWLIFLHLHAFHRITYNDHQKDFSLHQSCLWNHWSVITLQVNIENERQSQNVNKKRQASPADTTYKTFWSSLQRHDDVASKSRPLFNMRSNWGDASRRRENWSAFQSWEGKGHDRPLMIIMIMTVRWEKTDE